MRITLRIIFIISLTLATGNFISGQSSFSSALLAEINLARTSPASYALVLQDYALLFPAPSMGLRLDLPSMHPALDFEGLPAIAEAISFLRAQRPLPALRASPVLSSMADSYLALQQRTGATGHGASPRERAARSATLTAFGEALAYGYFTPRAIIIALIIDDNVPSRGHRQTLFSPYISYAGIAYGSHPSFGSATVIEVAGSAIALTKK